MTGPLLTLDGLHVSYPAREGTVGAVRGVSFTLERGEVLGLVGASGCGKSTVIGALAGLLPPTAALRVNRLSLDAIDLGGLDEKGWQKIRGRRIGFIPQQPMTALTPTVDVGRQLDWYLGPRAVERHEEALRHLGLDCVVERPGDLPARFSGGQLQRLLIAVNTVNGAPDLLLADEPTSTLDATVQQSILERLADLRADHGVSMVLVSHDLAVVSRLADRVGVLHEGSLVELAPVEELFDHPTHAVTQALVGAVPRRTAPAVPVTSIETPRLSPAPVLAVDRLYHYYGQQGRSGRSAHGRVVRAVDDVSFTADQGEVLAVVGESGSGKSTVARAVAGALVPTAGSIHLDGRDVTARRTLSDRRHIQLVTQNPRAALNRRRRVGHALDQVLRVHGLGADATARRDASAEVLRLVHLSPAVLDRRPVELSGGELARVVLARALLLQPRVLLLDEPTASLDAPVKAAVLDVVSEISQRLELATVIITHELSTARTVADRVAVMEKGHVVETGVVGQVLEDPVTDYTRALLASEVALP